MNQLESQVNDLRSFLAVSSLAAAPDAGEYTSPGPHPSSNSNYQSPLSAPGDNSAQDAHLQTGPPGSHLNSAKRKVDDGDGSTPKQQRSKRNRYISIACNECKRRKIKCNGETPCQRCGNLNLQCLYAPNCCSTGSFKDSDEFKQMREQVGLLQEQVDSLFNSMSSLRQETLRLAPIQERILPPPSVAATPSPSISSAQSIPVATRVPSSFNGPTSTAFTVDMAKNTLHKMGYKGGGEATDEAPQREEVEVASPRDFPAGEGPPRPARDPLWDFDKEEMVRLCRVHEEEVGLMYPVVKMDSVIRHAEFLGNWMRSWKSNMGPPMHGEGEGLSDTNSLLLKIVMCNALVVEEHGHSAKATRIYDSIRPIVDRMLMSDPPDVLTLPFLALVGGYRFLSNDEVIAWRVIGQVSRLCLELGLHRRDGLENIKDPLDRRNAMNTFWSAYVLDRRWAFGTGLPYVFHDDKIDPKLPYPDAHPYLVAMITYSQLGAKIWRLVDYFEPAVIRELKRGDFEKLDEEILTWYASVPEDVKIDSLDLDMMPVPGSEDYDTKRLQIWTRLRMHQIRIWLLTPVLHSAGSIAGNMTLAQRVVDLAKGNIQYLARLNSTTTLYRRLQTFYHQFLTSAIAVLFLASTHAPLQFSAVCRTEFYMALELIKNLSTRSWVSQRLWRTVRSLKSYAMRLGMEENDGHPNAAAVMAVMDSGSGSGSGGRRPSHGAAPSPSPYPPHLQRKHSQQNAPHSSASTPITQQAQLQMVEDHRNGISLQTEMSRIYEGYTGMNGIPSTPSLSPDQVDRHGRISGADFVDPDAGVSDTGQDGRGSNGSVFQHFKDMF